MALNTTGATVAVEAVGEGAETAVVGEIKAGRSEAVAGLLMRSGVSVPFRQIGLPDAFLDAGALPTLHDRYGISTAAVVAAVKGWL